METTHLLIYSLKQVCRTSYQPLDQVMRRTREEKTRSEKDNSFGVTTLKNFDFKDMWSFNHPHLNVKDCWEKLRQVEVPIKKGEF